MNQFTLLLCFLILLSPMSFAEKPTNMSYFKLLEAAEGIEAYELKNNGLTVLLHPIEDMPVATVMLTYQVGSRNESEGVTGATHILEHMMFKGTHKNSVKSEMDYSNQMERIGARSNATTYYDRTNYYATLASKHVPLAIKLEADRMRNLDLNEAALASEMIVVRNEYERRENNPYATLQKKIFSTAFEKHPYHHPVIGWKKDIESITVEKLQNFYDRFYWPNNAVLSIIGGFDKQETLDAVLEHFSPISKSPEPIPKLSIQEPEQTTQRTVRAHRTGQVGAVIIAHKVPHGLHSDWAALLLLSEILGADKVGRLYKALDDKGLASASYAFPIRLKDPGLLFIGASLTTESSHEQIEAIINQEIDSLVKAGISEAELKRAKTVFQTNLIYARDGSQQIADLLNDAIALGDWKEFLNISKLIDQVQREDLQRVAKKYLKEQGQTIGWYIPDIDPAELGDQVSQTTSPENFNRPYYFNEPYTKLDFWENDFQSDINFTPKIRELTISDIHFASVAMSVDQVISCTGSIPVGDSTAPKGSELLADLTASMLDKGTENMDRFEIAASLNSLGMQLQFESVENSLVFRGRFLKKDCEQFIKLLAELLRRPKFDHDVLENLKTQLRASILELESSTDFISGNQLSRLLYSSDHPNYQANPAELLASLEAISTTDLSDFHQNYYGSTGMKIVFAGDVHFPSLQKHIRNQFSNWKSKTRALPKIEAQSPSEKQFIEYFIPDKTSVSVRMGTNTSLKRSDPKYIAFSVANYILGGNFNARLMKSIRQKQGLTYSIYSFHTGDILTPGHWELSASFAPKLLDQGLEAIHNELLNWYKHGVTDKEVRQAIETMKGKYLVGLSQSHTVANQIHSFMSRGFAPSYIDIYPKLLNRVSVNQTNQAIQSYFNPESIQTIAVGSLISDADKLIDIQLTIEVPNPAWKLQITEIYETDSELLVLAQIDSKNAITSQVISTISDTVTAELKDGNKPIQYYLIGKKWNWNSPKNSVVFIESREAIQSLIKKATRAKFKKKIS